MSATVIDPVSWPLLALVAGAIFTSVGAAVCVTRSLDRQFSENRRLFYRIISLHNREDDDRFEELSNDIWRIHLRNAQRDGDNAPERKTFPRRRYLQEVMGEEATS